MGIDIYPSLPVEMSFGLPVLGRLVNYDTVINSFLVGLVLVVLAWLGTRRLRKLPGRFQAALEAFVGAFDSLTREVLGDKLGRRYLPLVGSLFLFVLFCNFWGVVPLRALPGFSSGGVEISGEDVTADRDANGRYDVGDEYEDSDGDGRRNHGVLIPPPAEPTADLNVPLGLALLFFVVGLGSQIYIKGPLAPVKDLFMDMGPFNWEGGAFSVTFRLAILVVFQVFMFFLNVVGKFAEVVSVSFRLFGNIFGGVVILAVIGWLLNELVLPIGLTFFFGIFVGTVQAFVFTMLNLTYLSLAVAED